ncbi:MAG: polysaccharide biosynthesis protein, partial [Bacilli bacterium]
MKILLTGAGGSIGFETLKQFMETDNEITVLDLDTRKNRKRLSKYSNNATIIYGSINDTLLIDKIVPLQDIIIHLAAVIPPLADRNPELTRKVNFYG